MVRVYDRPPDGGWGWAVAIATTMTYAIVWGIPRGMSVLFLDLQQKYDSSNAKTSWITSMIFGCFSCGTLVGSLVTSWLGPRRTMMFGGLISCFGIIIVSQASILQLVYVGSAITGIGFGFAYCNVTSQLGIYFDKRRALVFGIGSMGSPLGGMLLPVMLTSALGVYGLEGALLIMAGFCLHLVVCGALLRPVAIKHNNNDITDDDDAIVDDVIVKDETLTNIVFSDTISLSSLDEVKGRSLYSLPSPLIKRKHISPHKAVLMRSLAGNGDLVDGGSGGISPIYKKNKQHKNDTSDSNTRAVEHDKQSFEHDVENQPCEKNLLRDISSSFLPYLQLFQSWRFMLYCFLGFLDMFARFIPTWFIVVHAESLGMSNRHGAVLLIIFSVMDGLTKLVTGYFASKMSKSKVEKGYEIIGLAVAQGIMAVSGLSIPSAHGFTTLAVCFACFGIGNGINGVWCIPIISRLVPIAQLPKAIGVYFCIGGVGILLGPPLTGYLADITGNYQVVFYFAGAIMVISVVCAAVLFALVRKFGIKRSWDKSRA
uniref:Monocarboxylate transporter 12-like n=1 Tax=Phallusia mammillata TaxID=59560 RepID=A0A6F9DSX6_9ASCI|nr:monocarboxylate transporter 12-like [Phallusia mammillata]